MFKLGRRSLGPALKAVRVSLNTTAAEQLGLTATNRTHQRGAQYNSNGTLASTNTSLRDCSNQYDTDVVSMTALTFSSTVLAFLMER
jgi:hypothetical protein